MPSGKKRHPLRIAGTGRSDPGTDEWKGPASNDDEIVRGRKQPVESGPEVEILNVIETHSRLCVAARSFASTRASTSTPRSTKPQLAGGGGLGLVEVQAEIDTSVLINRSVFVVAADCRAGATGK